MNEPVEKLLELKAEPLEAVTPQTTVIEAIERMNRRRIGSILVMEGDRLAGIFTERDVLTRVVPQGLDPAKTPVAEVMTRAAGDHLAEHHRAGGDDDSHRHPQTTPARDPGR